MIVTMNIEVEDDDKFVKFGSSKREERIMFTKKNKIWFRVKR